MEPFSLLWMGLCSTTLGNSLLFMKKKTNKQKYLKHFFEIWKQNISHYFEWVSAVICHRSVAMQVWSLCQWETNKGEQRKTKIFSIIGQRSDLYVNGKATKENIYKKTNFIIHWCKSCHEKLHVVYFSNINIYVDVWKVLLYA